MPEEYHFVIPGNVVTNGYGGSGRRHTCPHLPNTLPFAQGDKGVTEFLEWSTIMKRTSIIKRSTTETNIVLQLGIDGTGKHTIDTSIKMLDHLLSQVARHGRLDLTLKASGDDEHHTAEDIAICLGKALNEALGDKLGIMRMGDATVPMDDALAMVAIDLGGRGYCMLDMSFKRNDMRGFHTDLIRHFLETFAMEARMNLHARILYGANDHHKAESLFKALGRALDIATRLDPKSKGVLPSTKRRIEG